MSTENRNIQRGAATREQLIAVATRLFAERGYEDTSIEAVLQEAGVSRGSLYHHFKGKEALFAVVVEAVGEDAGRRSVAAAEGAQDVAQALRAACLAWVELARDPVVQRVLLIDAPAVLGWQRWRELDEQHALGDVRMALTAIADGGQLDHALVDMFAHVLMASMNEIALVVARADDQQAAARAGREAVDELLTRLLR
jgi:AcrR family transcriptional regulator